MAVDNADSPSSFQMPLESSEHNHRKRRRNRMRVSCLNCYASKRKCDRKRPCTRCIKHGLTGLCVYELDDPAARDKTQVDETTRLRNRIAELESVIRSLNNRPHPRWLAPDGVTHDPSLVALRRGTRRRAKAISKFARSASVEAFFDAIADEEANGDSEDCKIKVEQEAFMPEFTPSEAGPSHSSVGSPLTPISPLSPESPLPLTAPYAISSAPSVSLPVSGTISASPLSTPFSFQDARCTVTTGISPPISSFVQGSKDGAGMPSCTSGRLLPNCVSPAASESSEDGPPLANLFPSQSDAELSPFANGFSAQPSIQKPIIGHASVGIQTTPTSLPVSRHCSPGAYATQDYQPCPSDSSPACRCLTNATVYSPLVHFASALRMSREALEVLHPPSSNCILFRRIMELDDHIFSAPPPTPPLSPQPTPVHDFLSNIYTSPPPPSQPTLTPSSPSSVIFDSAVRHPHAHTLPFYSPVTATTEDHYLDPQTFAMTSDMFTHPADAAMYSQLRGWDVGVSRT